jgi:hypothetical protein
MREGALQSAIDDVWLASEEEFDFQQAALGGSLVTHF